MRLRWRAQLPPHRFCERQHPRRKPERRLPQKVLRWSTSPSRSNRSNPESTFHLNISSQHFAKPFFSTASHGQEFFAAQEGEQRQQRQAENGEMVAFDALEQMHAQSFELVSADACCHRFPCPVQIELDFRLV